MFVYTLKKLDLKEVVTASLSISFREINLAKGSNGGMKMTNRYQQYYEDKIVTLDGQTEIEYKSKNFSEAFLPKFRVYP